MTLDLTTRKHIDLFFSNLLARLNLDQRVDVRILERDGYFIARIPGRDIAIPSAKRWRNYKRGWDRRLKTLCRDFGIGKHVHVQPNDVVIDVGANIGEFSSAMAKMGARVHAVEGDPFVFKCLEHNLGKDANVTLHQNALWKEDTVLTFYSEPTDANSSFFQPTGSTPARPIEVQACRLDTLAENFGIGQVAFLKCDAEGAEPEVIEGARSLLLRTNAVAFDTGPERMGSDTSEECSRLLAGLGFQVINENPRLRRITMGIRGR